MVLQAILSHVHYNYVMPKLICSI